MNKKLIALFAAAAALMTAFAVYIAINGTGRQASRPFQVSLVSACDAADRVERLVRGAVSGTDADFDRSAFHMDFVPQEPVYIERFRDYDGPSADFVPVLMYHFFYDADVSQPTKGDNSHSIQSVAAQLQWLWEEGYVTLSMDELYEWTQGGIEVPAKCVVITSDDGQDNFYDLLQPLLHKYGFIATSFVITSYRTNIPYKLTLPNIEMHCHTHNMHRGSVETGGYPTKWGMMQGVSVAEGVEDMLICQQTLNGSLYFAYPYGNFGGNAKEILAQTGIRLAFTTQGGVVRRGMDLYELPRVRVSGSVSPEHFQRLVRYPQAAAKYNS